MEATSSPDRLAILEAEVRKLNEEIALNKERFKLIAEVFSTASRQREPEIAMQILGEGAQRLGMSL